MADAPVEDIESDSDISSFDNDDYSDDSDDNHYQQIARDSFGDSDSEDDEVFEGFPIQMPENVNWTLIGQPVREQDDLYVHDQPHQGPTVNMDENTRPIDIFSLFFTDELIDRLVEWTNNNYAQKKRLQPEKHQMKWTDMYPDEIRAFLVVLIIMNDMIIVPRFERTLFYIQRLEMVLTDTRNTYYFYKRQVQTVEKVFTFL